MIKGVRDKRNTHAKNANPLKKRIPTIQKPKVSPENSKLFSKDLKLCNEREGLKYPAPTRVHTPTKPIKIPQSIMMWVTVKGYAGVILWICERNTGGRYYIYLIDVMHGHQGW